MREGEKITMEVKAVAKYIKVQPRKVRIIADEIRGKSAVHSAALLRFHPGKSARLLRKVLVSAMANAMQNHNIAPETLKIATIMVDEGPRMKRMQARAMGRGNRIVKKTSHITVVVEEAAATAAPKAHGTKAKPRPTFAAAPAKKGKAKKEEPKAAAPVVEEEVVETVEAAEVAAAEPEEVVEATAEQAEAPAEEIVADEEPTSDSEADEKEKEG